MLHSFWTSARRRPLFAKAVGFEAQDHPDPPSGTFFTWPWWSSASWNWWIISQRTSRAPWCIWPLDRSQIRVKVLVDDCRNDSFSGDAASMKCTCRDAVYLSYISWKSKSFQIHIYENLHVYTVYIYIYIFIWLNIIIYIHAFFQHSFW